MHDKSLNLRIFREENKKSQIDGIVLCFTAAAIIFIKEAKYFIRGYNNNNNLIYIAPLKTIFTKCSTESQCKTSGIARNQYYI